jgi:hypothetical protein
LEVHVLAKDSQELHACYFAAFTVSAVCPMQLQSVNALVWVLRFRRLKLLDGLWLIDVFLGWIYSGLL